MSCEHNLSSSHPVIADKRPNRGSDDEICEMASKEKNDKLEAIETEKFQPNFDVKWTDRDLSNVISFCEQMFFMTLIFLGGLSLHWMLHVQYQPLWGNNVVICDKIWTGKPYIETIEWGLQNLKNGNYTECVKFVNFSDKVYYSVEILDNPQHYCLEFVRLELIHFIYDIDDLILPHNRTTLDTKLEEAISRWIQTEDFLSYDLNSLGLIGGRIMTVNNYAVMVLQELFDFILSSQHIKKTSVSTQFLKTVIPKNST